MHGVVCDEAYHCVVPVPTRSGSRAVDDALIHKGSTASKSITAEEAIVEAVGCSAVCKRSAVNAAEVARAADNVRLAVLHDSLAVVGRASVCDCSFGRRG